VVSSDQLNPGDDEGSSSSQQQDFQEQKSRLRIVMTSAVARQMPSDQ
jgi:hypothetical protein